LRLLTEQTLSTASPNILFVWQGGEPTLAGLDFYKEVAKFQELYRYPGQKISNSMQTNGILLDNSWIRFLKQEDWLLGVSLDGNGAQHDTYRKTHAGYGTFKETRRALQLLQSENVPYNVLVLLNDVNIKDPKTLYNYLKNEGHRYLQFLPCIEFDKSGERTGYSITPEEYGWFLVEVFDEWVKDIPDVFVRDFEDILIKEVTGVSPNCVYSECGKYLVIEYNGDVYPCDFFVEPELRLGNIYEDSLEEILEGERFSDFKDQRMLREECLDCTWLNYCNGGCQKHTREDRNYFCESYKMFFRLAHTKIQEIKNTITRPTLY